MAVNVLKLYSAFSVAWGAFKTWLAGD